MAKCKKKVQCVDCKNYDGVNCNKKGNVGVILRYRQERQFHLQKPEQLNANGDCKDYAKL